MAKVALYNTDGQQVGEVELDDSVFGVTPNEAVVHEAVVMQLASRRRGTQSAKTRAEVSGGGKKPWRQKGTGRARAGSSRSPLWKKGGVIFAPKPRSYQYSIPRKKRRLALKSVLSDKVSGGNLILLDQLSLEAPKTKDMVRILSNLNVSGKALIVTADNPEFVMLSARNIQGVLPMASDGVNVYDILNHDVMVATQDAIQKIQEVLADA
ncbi:MAG: 50S ribosomal protein L4 [Peptococcaceae bacterium]|jgi:large subunit ribosomal protein L4|nr:50S ribosomal protein L4 [Peptococcaceae bacterium]